MAKLTLSGSKLAIKLRNATSLNATTQDVVEVLGPGRDKDEICSSMMKFGSSSEPHWN
jgi:hypothetical protein